jgi:hypothetical protein
MQPFAIGSMLVKLRSRVELFVTKCTLIGHFGFVLFCFGCFVGFVGGGVDLTVSMECGINFI